MDCIDEENNRKCYAVECGRCTNMLLIKQQLLVKIVMPILPGIGGKITLRANRRTIV